MADVATSEIYLYDHPTKTVTLTPTRATVVREINTSIQPGLHELTIVGLDPKVDVDSIRIEGSGSATITDIQTHTVLRGLKFEDVYPQESDGSSSSDYDFEPDKLAEIKHLRSERASADERLARARTEESLALEVTGFMDTFRKNMAHQNTSNEAQEVFIGRYAERRLAEHERHYKAKAKAHEEEKKIASFAKKIQKLEEKRQRSHDKRLRERDQERSRERRKWNERRQFWSSVVTQVAVHLDSHSVPTPGSTRRSSMSRERSVTVTPGESSANIEVNLRLTYVVPNARWTSRYELSINTPASTAQATYGAEFHNQSSEIWQDAAVTLSTSQTSFSGLHETVPSLQPWYVKLTSFEDGGKEQPSWENILGNAPPAGGHALQDYQMQTMLLEQQNKRRRLMEQKDQEGMTGTGKGNPTILKNFDFDAQIQMASVPPHQTEIQKRQQLQLQQIQIQQAQQAQQATQTRGLLGSGQPQSSLFAQQQQAETLFGQQPQMRPMLAAPAQSAASAPPPPAQASLGPFDGSQDESRELIDLTMANTDDDSEALPPALEYQDSVRQEYGITTTYDLPGRRTLVPSKANRRHALAKLDFKSVTLQHVIVPKHRAAAFLRARIRNTSSVNILRGRVGLTVDDTFLGTTTMPNCARNDLFHISLGVDPSILVTYGKPTVRRETTGSFFAKEDAAIFRRTCWVKNTKGITANIVVIDQVPMTMNEKLQMQISEPRGLEKEGDVVKMTMEADKGEGHVTMVKNGVLKWVLRLEPGKDVRVALEYEMKAPKGTEVHSESYSSPWPDAVTNYQL